MNTLRIISLELLTTLPLPLAVWVVFDQLHLRGLSTGTPPTRSRRAVLLAAIIVWIFVWRWFLYRASFDFNLFFKITGELWWLAGLAAFALIAGSRGNRALPLFSAAFYTGVSDCTEAILNFLSHGALDLCDAFSGLAYFARGACAFAGLAWALGYCRLMRKFQGRFPLAYALVTALVPFATITLLWAFRLAIEASPDPAATGAALYLWGGVFAVVLFVLNMAVFFLYLGLHAAKSSAAEAAQAAADSAARKTGGPFTLSARFIEKYEVTASQRKVVEAVLAGMPYREIAETLRLSVNTVKTHLKAVYANTGVNSRHALTALALDEG
ncbi:MAG: helix-turn-helix transcriptional regulator [Treponematales bacterium]